MSHALHTQHTEYNRNLQFYFLYWLPEQNYVISEFFIDFMKHQPTDEIQVVLGVCVCVALFELSAHVALPTQIYYGVAVVVKQTRPISNWFLFLDDWEATEQILIMIFALIEKQLALLLHMKHGMRSHMWCVCVCVCRIGILLKSFDVRD